MLQSPPSSLPSLFRQIGQILLAFSWWWWGPKSHLNIFGRPYILMLTVIIQQEKKSCDCRLNEMKLGLQAPWGPESPCLSWGKWDGHLSCVVKMERLCSGFFTGEMCSECPFRWADMQRALHKEVPQWPTVLMAVCKPSGRCRPHPAN